MPSLARLSLYLVSVVLCATVISACPVPSKHREQSSMVVILTNYLDPPPAPADVDNHEYDIPQRVDGEVTVNVKDGSGTEPWF